MADRLTLETGTTGIMNDISKQMALAAVAIYAIIGLTPHGYTQDNGREERQPYGTIYSH
jgi:hypothetical protein